MQRLQSSWLTWGRDAQPHGDTFACTHVHSRTSLRDQARTCMPSTCCRPVARSGWRHGERGGWHGPQARAQLRAEHRRPACLHAAARASPMTAVHGRGTGVWFTNLSMPLSVAKLAAVLTTLAHPHRMKEVARGLSAHEPREGLKQLCGGLGHPFYLAQHNPPQHTHPGCCSPA